MTLFLQFTLYLGQMYATTTQPLKHELMNSTTNAQLILFADDCSGVGLLQGM